MALDSDDESDSMSSVSIENGNISKKAKITEKDKSQNNKEKKNDATAKPDKSTIETNKEQSIRNKEVKTTSVMHMLQAKRDAKVQQLKSSSQKGSKSTSSATSDDSTSSDSDSSDSSSDADPNRISDDDDFDNVKTKAIGNVPTGNILMKVQTNGTATSNNIPQEIDMTFFENLTSNHRDSINRLVEYSKNPHEQFFQPEILDLLYG